MRPRRDSGPSLPFVRHFLESLVSLIAPDVCAGCDARTPVMTVFCPDCARTLVPAPAARDGVIAPFVYGGALAKAIGSFKYDPRVDRARPLSHLLLGALAPLRRDPPTHVVPVPLHPSRAALRGFNQSALLAAPVARSLKARFAPTALARTRDTAPQASLGRDTRLRNLDHAFVARAPLRGARVLLVDDVRTTGATLDACAAVLRDAGADDVRSLVLARTE